MHEVVQKSEGQDQTTSELHEAFPKSEDPDQKTNDSYEAFHKGESQCQKKKTNCTKYLRKMKAKTKNMQELCGRFKNKETKANTKIHDFNETLQKGKEQTRKNVWIVI